MDSLRDRIARVVLEADQDGFTDVSVIADRILALFSDELDKVDDLNDLHGKIGDK